MSGHKAIAAESSRRAVEWDRFFPRLRRGHSAMSVRCPAENCSTNRGDGKGDAHYNRTANINDWKDERGIKHGDK